MSRSEKGTMSQSGRMTVLPSEIGRIGRGLAGHPAFIYSARSVIRSFIGRHPTDLPGVIA